MYAPSAVTARGYTHKFRFLPGNPGYEMVSRNYRRLVTHTSKLCRGFLEVESDIFDNKSGPLNITAPVAVVRFVPVPRNFLSRSLIQLTQICSPPLSKTPKHWSSCTETALWMQRRRGSMALNVSNTSMSLDDIHWDRFFLHSSRSLWLSHTSIFGQYIQSTHRLLWWLHCKSSSVCLGVVAGYRRCIWTQARRH